VPEIIKIEKGMVYLSKPKIFSDPFCGKSAHTFVN